MGRGLGSQLLPLPACGLVLPLYRSCRFRQPMYSCSLDVLVTLLQLKERWGGPSTAPFVFPPNRIEPAGAPQSVLDVSPSPPPSRGCGTQAACWKPPCCAPPLPGCTQPYTVFSCPVTGFTSGTFSGCSLMLPWRSMRTRHLVQTRSDRSFEISRPPK